MLENLVSIVGVSVVVFVSGLVLCWRSAHVWLINRTHDVVSTEAWDDMVQERMRVLLEELLFGIALTRIFSHPKAPSFFLIYAHDNPDKGEADDRTVKQFIRNFESMHAKIRSDRCKDLQGLAKTDIFHNQACLLPKRLASRAVDRVVLFHSEVLSSYCREKQGREYILRVKETCRPMLDELYDMGDCRSIEPRQVSEYQEKIKALINSQEKLHHVLTELAFVELRVLYDRSVASIIPVSLRGGQTKILNDLPYLRNTSHYLSMKHLWDRGIYEQQRFFLQLVERIYGKAPLVIDFIKARYDEGIAKIRIDPQMSINKFRKEVRWQLTEDLRRFSINGPFEISQIESHDYGEVWEEPESQSSETNDTQLSQSADHDMTFRGVIPQWLLVEPDEAQRRNLYILHSLDQTRQFQGIATPYSGTLKWLDHNRCYQKWIVNEEGMLGIRGKPGSGKSTAMKCIFERLQQDEKATHLHLRFFFSMMSDMEQRTRRGFYRSLLFQLLSRIPSAGVDYWRMMAKRNRPDTLTLDDLQKLFLSALSNACDVSRVRLFVDALDEAGETEMREVVADLRKLNMVINRGRKSLSICYACRYFPAIVVDNGLQIKIDQENRSDISQFIQQELESWRFEFDDTLRKDVQRRIVEQTNGVFIYAVLVVRLLQETTNYSSAGQILDLLDCTPQPLKDLYDRALHKALGTVDPNNDIPRRIIAAVAQCVVNSDSPPTVTEIQAILAAQESTAGMVVLETGELARLIEKYSDGLLRVIEPHNNGDPVVNFVHDTVRQYFHDHVDDSSSWLFQ